MKEDGQHGNLIMKNSDMACNSDIGCKLECQMYHEV